MEFVADQQGVENDHGEVRTRDIAFAEGDPEPEEGGL